MAEAFDDIVAALAKVSSSIPQSGPAVPTPNTAGASAAQVKTISPSSIGQPSPTNGLQGVTSFTGDGTVLSNSASTGSVIAALEAVVPNAFLGGPEYGSSAELPTYRYIETPDLPLGGTWDFMGILSGNFDITGNFSVLGELLDYTGSPGTNGEVLTSTGTGVRWENVPTLGVTSFSAGQCNPLFATSVANPTTTPTLSFSLDPAAPNAFWCGPEFGSTSAIPNYRYIETPDLPPGGTWDFMGVFSGNFDVTGSPLFTNAVTLGFQTYGGGIQNSPSLIIAGVYEATSGPTYAEDSWTIQNVVGTGVNGTSTLTFTHSGTSGAAALSVPTIYAGAGSASAPAYSFAASHSTGMCLFGSSPYTIGFGLNGNTTSGLAGIGPSNVPYGFLAAPTSSAGFGYGFSSTILSTVATSSFDTAFTRNTTGIVQFGGAIQSTGYTDWNGELTFGDAVLSGSLRMVPIVAPSAPTLTVEGTGASTTYTYAIVALDVLGNAIAGATATTNSGPTTLNGINYIQIHWTQVAGAWSYNVYRTVGGTTQGNIKNVLQSTVSTVNDTGLTGDGTSLPATSVGVLQFSTDTGISRVSAGVVGIGTGAQGSVAGQLDLATILMTAASGAPTSAGTAGTAGEIIYYGGNLYFCSVTGAAGSATWNKVNLTAV